MKKSRLTILLVIFCIAPGMTVSPGLGDTAKSASITTSYTQSVSKETTIIVDHYRPPCVDQFGPQFCYLLATEERPSQFPYFYGDIEEFKFQWGHEYRLLVIQKEAPRSAASRNSYRLVKILSDKKIPLQRTFDIPLKLPLNPPFFNSDDSSNIYLLGEVKINIRDAKLKSRLLKLRESATPLDSIRGTFKHDQKQDGAAITLISLNHEQR